MSSNAADDEIRALRELVGLKEYMRQSLLADFRRLVDERNIWRERAMKAEKAADDDGQRGMDLDE